MKRIFFSLLFLSALALGASAQNSTCAKTCAAKKGTAASSCQSKVGVANAVPSQYQKAAAKLASMDTNIEQRTSETGEVSYVRKETCAFSGSVAYVDLSYDPAMNTFVNVSPAQVEKATTSGCSGAAKATSATSCSGAAKTTSANGKACCAGGTKAACATKAKAADADNTSKTTKGTGSTKS